MVPTAGIYSIKFEFWYPQLHQHLWLHSTYHLNNKTYPLTPDLHCHQYLHLCVLYWLLDSRNLYKKWLHQFVHSTLYTTTFRVYSSKSQIKHAESVITFLSHQGQPHLFHNHLQSMSEWAASYWHISTQQAIQCHEVVVFVKSWNR